MLIDVKCYSKYDNIYRRDEKINIFKILFRLD